MFQHECVNLLNSFQLESQDVVYQVYMTDGFFGLCQWPALMMSCRLWDVCRPKATGGASLHQPWISRGTAWWIMWNWGTLIGLDLLNKSINECLKSRFFSQDHCSSRVVVCKRTCVTLGEYTYRPFLYSHIADRNNMPIFLIVTRMKHVKRYCNATTGYFVAGLSHLYIKNCMNEAPQIGVILVRLPQV